MNNEYVSKTLYHFVGSKHPLDDEKCFELLKTIINSGYIAARDVDNNNLQFRLGDTQLRIDPKGKLIEETLVKGNITCFCDIPIKSQGIHHTKYGRFGIGFKLEVLALLGSRPVQYLPYSPNEWGSPFGRLLIDQLDETIKEFFGRKDSFKEKYKLEKVEDTLLHDFAVFLKPYNRDLPLDHLQCYYTEREWRKLGSVEIKPEHVDCIVVPRGYGNRLLNDIPAMISYKIIEP